MNYLSKVYRKQENVTVIIPTNGMDDMKEEHSIEKQGIKYQTLWLLHGGGGDNSDWVNFSNIIRYANTHRVAVVMPAGKNFHEEPAYTHVTEELPKLLRILFPLSDRKEDNFIAGLSFGGDAAMRACLEYPDRYACGIVMSAAGTDHKPDSHELRFDVYGMAEKDLASGQELPKLIFATGSGDRGFTFYVPVIDKLDEMGYPLTRYYVDGEGHSWDFWDNTIRKALDEKWLPVADDVITG